MGNMGYSGQRLEAAKAHLTKNQQSSTMLFPKGNRVGEHRGGLKSKQAFSQRHCIVTIRIPSYAGDGDRVQIPGLR